MSPSWGRDPVVMFTEVGRGAVLLDPRTRRIFDLNPTGTVVWVSIDEGIESVVVRLVERFAIDEETARRDVEGLLAQFVEAGLVVRRAE